MAGTEVPTSAPPGERENEVRPPGSRRSRGRTRALANGLGQVVLRVAVPVVGLGLWELAGQKKWLAGGLFPPVSSSIGALYDFILGGSSDPTPYSGKWLANVGASAVRILAGYAIGSALAVFLGLAAGYFVVVRKAIDPTINALRPISIMAWIPLALIIFGIGNKPAIFLTALATFYPVYISTILGARFTDAKLIRAAQMLGCSRRQILFRVTLPATLPSIASGMRVALALAWTTVVVAEILGAKSGIGYVLIDSYSQFRFDYVIACMITLGVLGYGSDKIVGVLFKWKLRWAHLSAEN